MKKILHFLSLFFLLFIAGCDLEITSSPSLPSTEENPKEETPNLTEQDTPKEDLPSFTEKEEPSNEPSTDITFEDYGFDVIEIIVSDVYIVESGLYSSMEEVGTYIYTFHKLPSNFKTKSYFNKNDYTKENKLSVGGDTFYNREKLLPIEKGRTYKECDIDYNGYSRNAKRIVFSSDFLIFYTDDHYESFSILRFI